MKTYLLFCYGSNNPEQLQKRIGEPRSMKGAYAPKHSRVFRGWSNKWQGGVASLVPSTKRHAYGYVAEVTEDQLALMDRYEGVASGNYTRKTIPVVVDDEATKAIAYVSTSEEFNPPSNDYLQAVLKTIRAFWQVDGVHNIVVSSNGLLSARLDAVIEATAQLRLSARARLALEEAAAVMAAPEGDLWEILDNGTPEEIEEALKPYKKLKINFLNKTLDDTYLVEDKIVEWESGDRFTTVKSKDDWLNDADSLRDDVMDKLAKQFRKDFAQSPGTLYHATDSSNIESIMEEGLRAESRTRGLTNRGVGAAIFTTTEPDVAAYGSYGDTVLAIDTAAMKRDGVRFTAEQEPAVVENEAMGILASILDVDDFYWETGGSDGTDDPSTVILFVRDNIAPKYLKVLD